MQILQLSYTAAHCIDFCSLTLRSEPITVLLILQFTHSLYSIIMILIAAFHMAPKQHSKHLDNCEIFNTIYLTLTKCLKLCNSSYRTWFYHHDTS